MSRFITQKDDGSYLEEIESMYECKSESGKKRSCFEKEDGIIENGGEPFSLETYYDK